MSSQYLQANFMITLFEEVPVIHLPARLTVLEAVDFKTSFQELMRAQPIPKQIILNFQQTKFIDSSGIGSLVRNHQAAQDQKIELVLENVNPTVAAVFSLTGLDKVFQIKSQISTPQQSFSPPTQQHLPTTHPSVSSQIKRSIDMLGGVVGLMITTVLFIPIAIAIKLDSSGPIFFKQTRCGWLGKKFTIWKFRSMCTNAEELKAKVENEASGAFFKNKNDPRITRVGNFLRRTSLDELPQFWNVVTGEMSLVGTRPPTPNEVEVYEVPEWQRLDVKPGMTGEWQVYGRSQVENFEDVIKLDLRYQENWSLVYDLKLIVKTVLILFNKNSGAY